MLERIDQEKAKQFISLKEDYTGGGLENASFFTLTPPWIVTGKHNLKI